MGAVPRRTVLGVLLTAVAIGASDGRRAAAPANAQTRDVVVWRPIGDWSGRGNTLTESFTSDTGSLRVRWTTDHEDQPGAGTFRLTLHSAISGRPLAQAVDHRGVGTDTTYVSENPHVFYAVVDSARLDWSFTIDEGIGAKTIGAGRR